MTSMMMMVLIKWVINDHGDDDGDDDGDHDDNVDNDL